MHNTRNDKKRIEIPAINYFVALFAHDGVWEAAKEKVRDLIASVVSQTPSTSYD